MKHLKFLTALFASSILTFASCNKGEDDVVAPQITMISPSEGSIISIADSINIEFIVDDEDLHEFTVEIKRITESDSTSTFTLKGHSHDRNYRYKNSVYQAVAGNYQLEVIAEDHNGNETVSETLFTLTN